MKKYLLILLSAMITTACSNAQETHKTLVAYFSATGTTKDVAIKLAKVADADTFEIVPTQKYTDADLDWTDKESRSTKEMKDKNSRPTIKSKIADISKYDVIYIGFPIWWYTAPTIINTFIESYNLKGKTVAVFATSGSSNVTKAADDLKKAYPDINWKEGKLLNHASEETMKEFVKATK